MLANTAADGDSQRCSLYSFWPIASGESMDQDSRSKWWCIVKLLGCGKQACDDFILFEPYTHGIERSRSRTAFTQLSTHKKPNSSGHLPVFSHDGHPARRTEMANQTTWWYSVRSIDFLPRVT